MGIELRHRVLVGHVNFEFERLCNLTSEMRKVKAARELELTNGRYMGYCAAHESLTIEMGALMIREGNYYQADGTFDHSFQPVHSDRLAATRRAMDELLIELLRSVDWSEERLKALEGVLEDRLQLESDRREELLAYAEDLRCRSHDIQGHVSRGHFGEACRILTATLEELREACKELEAKINEPATGT